MASKRGLTPRTFKGLNKKRIESSSGSGKRLAFKDDEPTQTVQFMDKITEFQEVDRHIFQEDGRWQFVPCAWPEGYECPLCDSDDEKVRGKSYTFLCNVLNIGSGQVQVLEGPKALAGMIFHKYERKPATFLKRVYDITKYPTSPASWNFELAEEDTVALAGKKKHDLNEYVLDEMKRYYGDDLDLAAVDLADDDEEDPDDVDDLDDEDEDEAPAPRAKKRTSKKAPPPEDDEDDDLDDDLDADDEDDDPEDDDDVDDDLDDEDEDDEPAPRVKKSTRATKKATPRRAATSKRGARR